MIGPQWQEDCERDEPTGKSSAIHHDVLVGARISVAVSDDDGSDFDDSPKAQRSEAFKMSISKDVRRFIRERLVEEGLYDMREPRPRLSGAGRLLDVLGNGVLDATDSDAENFNSLVWSNRTIQQFLAAYWYARACARI